MEQLIPSGPDAADLIKDTDTQSFIADVIDASRETPVIVDFWAPWCGPCKTLGPMIEKVVRDAGGAVRMVKLNIDENPQIAQQMQIQSIPAVYAFKDGRPVDGFVGAVPESQVKAFVTKLIGQPVSSPIDEALDQAKAALEAGDAGTAGALFGQVLGAQPENAIAAAGMARCYLAQNQPDQARELLDALPEDARKDAFVAAAISALELAEQSADTGNIDELAGKVEANASDHQARFDLAMALFGASRNEEAIEALLESIRRDREWNEQAARKQLLKFFEAWGPTHELSLAGRRQLSALLFS